MAREIDMTPTWRALVPIFCAVLENGGENGKKAAREELLRMAEAADLWNASCPPAAKAKTVTELAAEAKAAEPRRYYLVNKSMVTYQSRKSASLVASGERSFTVIRESPEGYRICLLSLSPSNDKQEPFVLTAEEQARLDAGAW